MDLPKRLAVPEADDGNCDSWDHAVAGEAEGEVWKNDHVSQSFVLSQPSKQGKPILQPNIPLKSK